MHVTLPSNLVALDATGATVGGNIGFRPVQIVGPATYSTGGMAVDLSASFSRILCVSPARQFVTASGALPGGAQGNAAVMMPFDNGGAEYAAGKFHLALGRIVTTPAGTVAAPVFTGSAIGGAVNCGAVGCTSNHPNTTTVVAGTCNTPAFTGTAVDLRNQELNNGNTAPNGVTYEVLVLGVLR